MRSFKIGSSSIGAILVLILSASLASAATDVANWSTGVSGTIGTAKISTDGTSATLTIDKISSGTATLSNTVVQGTLGVTGKISGTEAISSYTYPVVVSGSNLTSVLMVQSGSALWHASWTTITQTFEKSFIATPVVVWNYTASDNDATGTVAVTVASNAFTIASPITNFSWIAIGRVK